VTADLGFYGALGLVSIVLAVFWNRGLFVTVTGDPEKEDSKGTAAAGRVSRLEGIYYFVGLCSLVLGWYFNVRYVHAYKHATYANYTKMLFTNWAADSAAQDYTIVNLVLLPLWTIVEGRRRGLKQPWIFFVMSLFTSLAFSVAMYLAFMERQLRFNRYERAESAASKTA
jgi:Terpene cyclase DEP1